MQTTWIKTFRLNIKQHDSSTYAWKIFTMNVFILYMDFYLNLTEFQHLKIELIHYGSRLI